jgi:hypothetical protein
MLDPEGLTTTAAITLKLMNLKPLVEAFPHKVELAPSVRHALGSTSTLTPLSSNTTSSGAISSAY